MLITTKYSIRSINFNRDFPNVRNFLHFFFFAVPLYTIIGIDNNNKAQNEIIYFNDNEIEFSKRFHLNWILMLWRKKASKNWCSNGLNVDNKIWWRKNPVVLGYPFKGHPRVSIMWSI